MFLYRYFKSSFKYKEILNQKENSLGKLIVFFIIMILIANFPLTFEAYKQRGSRLDFIIEDFSNEYPDWTLPSHFSIKGGKLLTSGDEKSYTFKYKDITYVFNNREKINRDEYKNYIFLNELTVVYIDDKGNVLEGYNYTGFEDEFSFLSLNLSTNEDREMLFQTFASGIEKSFSKEIILYTIVRNIGTQLFISTIYVLLLSLLVQLFRFGYQDFMTYKEGLMFVLHSISLPAILSFGFGLLSPPFGPVAFQLASGILVMAVILFFGKKTLA